MNGKTLWDYARQGGDALFCRKGWVAGKKEEFLACLGWSVFKAVGKHIRDVWNHAFMKAGADWATWGPRAIGPDWEKGTIRAGFKRTFIGFSMPESTTRIEIQKLGGKAKATATACVLDYAGNVVSTKRLSFDSGKGGTGVRNIQIRTNDARIVGVVVDTPASVNKFKYRARLVSKVKRNHLPPVRGIADIHMHELMNLGFAGRMMWGQDDGPPAQALAPDVVEGVPTGHPPTVKEILAAIVAKKGIDANVLLEAMSPNPTDQGLFTLGGGGDPGYAKWPRFTNRAHQLAYISWIQAAHRRHAKQGANLQLLVVSLVNNNILCSVLKAVDPNGNVPKFDAKGNIVGWKSKKWGCTDEENITREIEEAHAIEKAHPWYRIAMNPWHARRIIADGDLAVVLSMESDKPLSGHGGGYGNWLHQLDFYRAMGVTTMQIVHESNDRFAGAAPHRQMMKLLQLIHWPIKSIGNALQSGSTFNLDAQRRNKLGLTRDGRKLIAALIERHMPIDLAHTSVRTRKDIFAIMDRLHLDYGLYDSHTKFQHLFEAHRGQRNYGHCVLDREKSFLITDDLLGLYVRHHVLVGLRTASVDTYDAPGALVANDCPGSATSYAQMVQYAVDNGLDIAYGTDINGGVSQLGPRFGPDACWAAKPKVIKHSKCHTHRPVHIGPVPAVASTVQPIAGTNYYTGGLSNIGWLPELTMDLISLRSHTPNGHPAARDYGASKLENGAEAFLKMWERAWSTPHAK